MKSDIHLDKGRTSRQLLAVAVYKPKILIAFTFLAVLSACASTTVRHQRLEAKARLALQGCAISADSINWRITDDGAFAFIPKDSLSSPFTDVHARCLVDWARENEIKLAVLGLE